MEPKPSVACSCLSGNLFLRSGQVSTLGPAMFIKLGSRSIDEEGKTHTYNARIDALTEPDWLHSGHDSPPGMGMVENRKWASSFSTLPLKSRPQRTSPALSTVCAPLGCRGLPSSDSAGEIHLGYLLLDSFFCIDGSYIISPRVLLGPLAFLRQERRFLQPITCEEKAWANPILVSAIFWAVYCPGHC